MYHVDFETLKRTPKASALFYKSTINAHGENIDLVDSKSESSMLPEYEPMLATS